MFHVFLLAAELGSARIGGNDLSSGIAGVNGENNRGRERERERERERWGKEWESPVTTNYSVKNLKFPMETGIPTIQWPFFLKFQKKKKERKIVQITANWNKSLIETSNYLYLQLGCGRMKRHIKKPRQQVPSSPPWSESLCKEVGSRVVYVWRQRAGEGSEKWLSGGNFKKQLRLCLSFWLFYKLAFFSRRRSGWLSLEPNGLVWFWRHGNETDCPWSLTEHWEEVYLTRFKLLDKKHGLPPPVCLISP